MTSMRKHRTAVSGIMLIACLSHTLCACAESAPAAPGNYTAQDQRAARMLNALGDRAYRAGQFNEALKAYMASYPNFPNPYAYLMSGDAYWRAVLASHQGRSGDEAGRCRVANEHFPSDLRRSLEEHFQRGLALHPAPGRASEPNAELRRRAGTTAACLGELARQYDGQPATTCVALDRLSACLGAPLLR